ncbi:MAG: hypothetical protein M4579_005012 [Chaenotheca gracillima]|nr:MAG: hypothetical protein M4579_005012 [Chaenotheca gracillima]
MFHTFQASSSTDPRASVDHSSDTKPRSRSQTTTTQACEECRRRKIRCNGKQPCSHCEWYKHPKLCRYSKKPPRPVPTQRLLDELSAQLKQSQRLLGTLLPDAGPNDLAKLNTLPRGELIDMVLSSTARSPPSASTSPQTDVELPGRSEDKGHSLEAALEQEPSPDANWDEAEVGPNGLPPVSDHVNALSMSVGRQSSYLGLSSVAAALRVISKITSALESVILSSPRDSAPPTRTSSPRRLERLSDIPPALTAPALDEYTIVNAYFTEIHPFIPMIDEARFRDSFTANNRNDPSWHALLNMVLAMGTIAASTVEDTSHFIYYHRAKQCLDLETFGNGHIEAIHALGIMGGFYLHYESRPNMASAIMGAAMRMACALGLHREYSVDRSSEPRSDLVRNTLVIPREVRRRTWWSLFCLDTWASTTTGRPSLGRYSPAVTVQDPTYLIDSPCSDEDICVMILCQEIAFCKIAMRIQDRLAEQPLLPSDETARFDAELRQWHASLPPILHASSAACPSLALTPRAVLRWRYHNLRLLLYRPVLLNTALRSTLAHPTDLSPAESYALKTCRAIATDAIAEIQALWLPTQTSGWHAVWLLFQAAMVPLITLFAEYNRGNFDEVINAQEQTEVVIELLGRMRRHSITAIKSRDVLSKIYEKSKLAMAHKRETGMDSNNDMVADNRDRIVLADPRAEQGFSMGMTDDYRGRGLAPGLQEAIRLTHRTSQMVDPYLSHPTAGNLGPSVGSTNQHPHQQPHHQQQGADISGVPGVDSNMMGSGNNGAPTGFWNEDEMNAFWNQIMWGEGDMLPDLGMDTSFDYAMHHGDPGAGPSSGGGRMPGGDGDGV